MTNKERSELINKYIADNPGLSHWNLAKKIFEDNNIPKEQFEALRMAVYRLYQKLQITEMQISVEEEVSKWEVIDGKYLWKSKNGIINLSVEFIDQLFYEFSEHGLNLTQTEIINKHNLQVWEWNSIKSTLWLYKKSNIFSPYTVQNTPPEQLEEMISGKIKALFRNTGFQVEKQYNKELNKKYKDAIKKQAIQDVTLQAMIMDIADYIPTCEVKPYIRVNKKSEGAINLFIFDLHYGAQNRTAHIPLYSPEIVKETLLGIAEIVNKNKAAEVNVFFGGDMIESWMSQMHVNQWKGMARGYFGANLIKELYKLLVEFLSQINNVKAVFAVPGNHDRSSEKREVDDEGSIAEILFELIKLAFSGKLPVKFDEKVISESIDGIQYIMTHGHFKLSNVTPAELVIKYGNPKGFNLLVSGHWHERKVKKDHELFRQIVCPALFPGNDYSVNLGYTASPGFIIVKNNEISNKPIVIDYTL